MPTSKVVLVVASEGYQPIEYSVPRNILENSGIQVVTVSDRMGVARAKDDTTTPVDMLLSDVNPDKVDGIFFIGGPGALGLLDNETSYRVIRKAAELRKPLGAICISTRILAKAGVLAGKQATGWDGDDQLVALYALHDVIYKCQPVVVDGRFVTATGPSVAQEFGEKILTLLLS